MSELPPLDDADLLEACQKMYLALSRQLSDDDTQRDQDHGALAAGGHALAKATGRNKETIAVDSDALLTLEQTRHEFPGVGDNPVHYETIRRWTNGIGTGGPVLETTRIGKRKYISPEDIALFKQQCKAIASRPTPTVLRPMRTTAQELWERHRI